MTTTTPREPIEGACYVPINLLAPSPTNPRKRFDQAGLDELAASLVKHGQIAPIVVRPHPGGTPELLGEQGRPLYEIVAGERRYRAARQAEIGQLMVLVRQMTDFEVLEVQVIENLQREDLEPIDEAEGYQALLRTPTGLQGYTSVDELAARVGRSRRYVYNRLKLLELCPPGRLALQEGRLAVSVAQIIAALPAEQQPQALERVLAGFGGEPLTFKAALDFVGREYMLQLERAHFDITVAYQVAGPCGMCPKRSGAHGDLFADLKSGDMCQDSACYQAKTDEAHALTLDAHRAAGHTVLSGEEARKVLPHWRGPAVKHYKLDDVYPAITTRGKSTLRSLLGPDFKPRVVIDDETSETIIELVPERAARAELKKRGLLREGISVETGRMAEARSTASASGNDDGDERTPAGSTSSTSTPAAAPKPLSDKELTGAKARRRDELLGRSAFMAVHQALRERDEPLLEPLRDVVLLVASELVGAGDGLELVHEAWGWPKPEKPGGASWPFRPLSSWNDSMRSHVETLNGRELADLLFELALVATECAEDVEQLANADTAASRLANALQIDLGALDKAAEAQAEQEIAERQEQALETARQAKRDKMLPPGNGSNGSADKTKSKPGIKAGTKIPVRFRNAATGETWSGRGLQPKWLKAALERGRTIDEFRVAAQADAATAAFVAGQQGERPNDAEPGVQIDGQGLPPAADEQRTAEQGAA